MSLTCRYIAERLFSTYIVQLHYTNLTSFCLRETFSRCNSSHNILRIPTQLSRSPYVNIRKSKNLTCSVHFPSVPSFMFRCGLQNLEINS